MIFLRDKFDHWKLRRLLLQIILFFETKKYCILGKQLVLVCINIVSILLTCHVCKLKLVIWLLIWPAYLYFFITCSANNIFVTCNVNISTVQQVLKAASRILACNLIKLSYLKINICLLIMFNHPIMLSMTLKDKII
jgi:hypothetical protein